MRQRIRRGEEMKGKKGGNEAKGRSYKSGRKYEEGIHEELRRKS